MCHIGMNVTGIANHSTIEFKVSSTGRNKCLVLTSDQELGLVGPSGESTTIVLIKEFMIKIPSKYVFLYLYISAGLSPHQRNFFSIVDNSF